MSIVSPQQCRHESIDISERRFRNERGLGKTKEVAFFPAVLVARIFSGE